MRNTHRGLELRLPNTGGEDYVEGVQPGLFNYPVTLFEFCIPAQAQSEGFRWCLVAPSFRMLLYHAFMLCCGQIYHYSAPVLDSQAVTGRFFCGYQLGESIPTHLTVGYYEIQRHACKCIFWPSHLGTSSMD